MRDPDSAIVAIIIAAHGHPEFLAEAVLCAMDQDLTNPTILVIVNDGCPFESTDELCRCLREAWGDRILYVRQPNRGLAAARNVGINLALSLPHRVDAIFFLDADDHIASSGIRRLYEGLLDHSAAWTFPDLNRFGAPRFYEFTGMGGRYSAFEHLLRNVSTASSLVRREVFECGIRFDESMRLGLEDWELWWQAIGRGFRGVHVRDVGFRYRKRPESMLQEAKRNTSSLVAAIIRKHRQWYHPRRLLRLEHDEAPRFALILNDTNQVALSTDPRFRSRTMYIDEFWDMAVYAVANRRIGELPTFIVVIHSEVLAALDAAGLTPGVLWDVENRCTEEQAVIAYAQKLGHSDSDQEQNASQPAFLMATMEWLLNEGHRTVTAADGLISACLPLPDEPLQEHVLSEFGRELCARAHRSAVPPIMQAGNRGRFSGSLLSCHRFVSDMNTPLPLVCGLPRLGALVETLYDLPSVHFEVARRMGFSVHLFVLSPLPKELHFPGREYVDTITKMAAGGKTEILDADRRNITKEEAERLTAGLAAMDAVISYECQAIWTCAAKLRSLGTAVAYCLIAETERERPGSDCVETALEYEHVIDAVLVKSESKSLQLNALGFPREKLFSDVKAFLCERQKAIWA